MTKLIQAKDAAIGDTLCSAFATNHRTIIAVRPVMTTAAGYPRKRTPNQVVLESRDEAGELFSDTVFCGSLVRVLG